MTLPRTLSQVGRYRIVREIGRGSMGRVYLAVDPNIDRHIALKVLAPAAGVALEDELRRRFLAETRAAGKLNHPNIVTVHDAAVDTETGLPYIAMEWVDGHSLQEELRLRGALPAAEAIDVVRQVAMALHHAHEHDLIHRDVKPANILLTNDGRAKLTDFGVAKFAAGGAQTLDGRVFGTPSYMSPEQILNQELDARSDLFSLGSCFYELLTGEAPFGGEAVASIVYRIVNVDARPLSLEGPGSAALGRILARLLAKAPDDRYARGAELVAELDLVTGQRSGGPGIPDSKSAAVQPVASAPPWRLFGGRIREVGYGALAALALSLLVLYLVSGERASTPESSLPEDSRLSSESESGSPKDEVTPPRPDAPPPDKARAASVDGEASLSSDVSGTTEPEATLVLLYINRLREATLTVLIDHHVVWSGDVEGPKNPLWKTVGKDAEIRLTVPAGRRTIEVRLQGSKGGLKRRDWIVGTFAEGERRRLRVTLTLPMRNLRLKWDR